MTVTITQVRNAASLQPDNLWMDVEINHPEFGWIEYAVNPEDTDTTINNDEVMALVGTDFAAYVPPTQEQLDAEAAGGVRSIRDSKLSTEVDPLVSNPLRWADLTEAKQSEWAQYRRDLLDITYQEGFPHEVIWPTQPE